MAARFVSQVADALVRAGVVARLQDRGAIVMERLVGNATRWYHCADAAALDGIVERLSPGSQVSFFFDRRLLRSRVSGRTQVEMGELIAKHGEIALGSQAEGEVEIDMWRVTSQADARDFVSPLQPTTWIVFGAIPRQDDDGKGAITVALPDADGVTRDH